MDEERGVQQSSFLAKWVTCGKNPVAACNLQDSDSCGNFVMPHRLMVSPCDNSRGHPGLKILTWSLSEPAALDLVHNSDFA
jgi:hypothetical protein